MRALKFLLACSAFAYLGIVTPVHAQSAAPSNTVALYAAGSLREALTQIAGDYQAVTGVTVNLSFGASGLLRERIEQGEAAQMFFSADTEHPARLARSGQWQAPVLVVRNSLCALTGAHVSANSESLLETLLNPAVRVGTSTPLADPSGDYAWELFRKAEQIKTGAYALLDAKALKLTGAADSAQPPAGRGVYGWLMEQGRADVFLTYCTNAMAAQREVPALKVVALPPVLTVGAAYGLTVRDDAPEAAKQFARHLQSAPAQTVFQRFGFGRP